MSNENQLSFTIAGNSQELSRMASDLNTINDYLLGLKDLPENVRKAMTGISSLSTGLAKAMLTDEPVAILINREEGKVVSMSIKGVFGMFEITRPQEILPSLEKIYFDQTQPIPAFEKSHFPESMRVLNEMIMAMKNTEFEIKHL